MAHQKPQQMEDVGVKWTMNDLPATKGDINQDGEPDFVRMASVATVSPQSPCGPADLKSHCNLPECGDVGDK